MVDTNKLRGIIIENGLTGEKVADMMGISSKTFYSRMKTAKFNSDEMDKLIEVLHIDDPVRIFFAQIVT